MKEEIPQILKQYYFCLLDYSLSGKMYSILSEDITKPNISFIKLVNSPKEYIKDNFVLKIYQILINLNFF